MSNVVRCKRYGHALGMKLDGGWCVCLPDQCRDRGELTRDLACTYPTCRCAFLWCTAKSHPPCPLTGKPIGEPSAPHTDPPQTPDVC